MDGFQIFYTFLGGLGLFYFGMRFMSDGMQAVAGDVIRKIINSTTTNRFMALGVGLLVTSIIQSSSVSTVMAVGFVNAGLMTLKQAIGLILGANIGTTITGWIISLGINKYGLLMVGLGFIPGLFSKTERWQHIARTILGLGLVYVGLQTMLTAFGPLKANEAFMSSISYFGRDAFGAYFASVLMGCLLTMVVQSSAAMLGITMALATSGVITFPTAVAMVLGENIGTTISAVLAGMGANVNARRAAAAHAIFKLISVLVLLPFLTKFISLINVLIPLEADYMDEAGNFPHVASHIAMTHTLFNVGAALIFLPFVDQLAVILKKLIRERPEKEVPHLMVLGDPANMLPAAALAQAESELRKMKVVVERMYKMNREFWMDSEFDSKKLAKIIDYERITDNIHKEITVFLCYVMEKTMSHHQSEQVQSLIKITDEMESVADYIERLANYRERFKKDETLTGESRTEFFHFMDEVWSFFDMVGQGLESGYNIDMTRIEAKSNELQMWADSMREKHLDRISKGNYLPITALTYSDMVVALRKIRAHSFLMAGAIENFHTKHD